MTLDFFSFSRVVICERIGDMGGLILAAVMVGRSTNKTLIEFLKDMLVNVLRMCCRRVMSRFVPV